MMNALKRKTPSTASPTPGPSSGFRVSNEDPEDVKRVKTEAEAGSSRLYAGSHAGFHDPRTAAVELCSRLKREGTMNSQTAYFHVQVSSPSHDAREVLELLKAQERVVFNEVNEVFTYIPDLTISTEPQLRTFIRSNSTPLSGIPVKTLREAMPPASISMLEDLERRGDVLIMRALTGNFRDAPLPKLGRENGLGLRINDGASSGNGRWKTVWWDEVRERGRAGKRVDDEFIFAWADVPIAEADDVAKLLTEQELSASSAIPPPPKVFASNQGKKKKKTTRPLKVTNTHMKDLGIDFSKDYERPS